MTSSGADPQRRRALHRQRLHSGPGGGRLRGDVLLAAPASSSTVASEEGTKREIYLDPAGNEEPSEPVLVWGPYLMIWAQSMQSTILSFLLSHTSTVDIPTLLRYTNLSTAKRDTQASLPNDRCLGQTAQTQHQLLTCTQEDTRWKMKPGLNEDQRHFKYCMCFWSGPKHIL